MGKKTTESPLLMVKTIKKGFLMTWFSHQETGFLNELFIMLDGQKTSNFPFFIANTIINGFL